MDIKKQTAHNLRFMKPHIKVYLEISIYILFNVPTSCNMLLNESTHTQRQLHLIVPPLTFQMPSLMGLCHQEQKSHQGRDSLKGIN